VSVAAPRQRSDQAAPEPGNERLKSLKTTFLNLVAARETEKALEAAVAFIEAAEARVIALERRVNDASRNNSNENIIDVIRKEVKTAVQTAIRQTDSVSTSPTTPRSWASIASSKPWGAGATAAQEPRVVVPARREREVVVRKGDGDPLQRTPVEVVRAVNSALGSNEAVELAVFRAETHSLLSMKRRKPTKPETPGLQKPSGRRRHARAASSQ